ncbi:AAA family ATPase, partial [Nonomuraea sp. NPDC055795]
MTTLDKARGWPFVGREQELKAISSAYGSASVHAVFLTGEAGVGKTRLAREALRRLGGRGEWVAASSAAAQIPFGALVHLVPDRVPVTAGSVQLMRAIGRRVRQAAVLGVDDAHLLDEASSAVIASLAGPVFVVATVRGGEGLADCLARLLRAGTARLLEVGVLPGSAMDLLIGPDRSAAERRRLRALAAGNPLALRELLHGAAPGGLTELMAARLAGLDPLTRRVVETIACGEPVPLPVLERLAGLEAVAEAESSGLIVGERSGERAQARLAHPLLGEVARRRAPVARLRQVHRDLAQQLMATPMRRRDDVLRAALWQVEGGEIIWPGLVREGARLAAGREGTALAERLARVACEAEPGAEADRLLAEILQYQGRTDEATLLLPGTPPGGTHERVRWTITRAEGLYWTHGDLTGALRAYEAVKGHPLADGARAFLLFFAGRHAETLLVAEPVLNRFESGPETPGWSGPGRAGRRPHGPASQAAVWAAAAAIASLGFQGRLDEALAVRVDEVPPHDDLLRERLAADQQHPPAP